MENKDEILRCLEDFNSSVEENTTIPEILENYLITVAKTGETLFPWEKLKALVVHKTDQAMKNFESVLSMDTLPTYPNVENATFEQLRLRILKALKGFGGAPFTIQRIAELITEPRKHYKRTDKFLRGIEKNVNIVTTVDPFGIRLMNDMVVVNGTDNQATPEKNTSLFVPPAPMNSPVTTSTVVTSPDTAASTVASGESANTSLFKALTSTPSTGSGEEPTSAQSSGSLFSLAKPHSDDQGQASDGKICENGYSSLNQDTPRVDTTSNNLESVSGKSRIHSESDTNNASSSLSKTENAESTDSSSGCYGSSSQGDDLTAGLPRDKVTVCVDTNEDEDVDVTNSDDDKMESGPEEAGVKREAAEVDSQEPPVKKQKQDDHSVTTTSSSQDIRRRESGGFDTMSLLEADSPSACPQSPPGTATQHSDVSSSVSQDMESKEQGPEDTATSETTPMSSRESECEAEPTSAKESEREPMSSGETESETKPITVIQSESETEAKPIAGNEHKDESEANPVETTESEQESESMGEVTKSGGPTNTELEIALDKIFGDPGRPTGKDDEENGSAGSNQDITESTGSCEPDSAGEMNTEVQDIEKTEDVNNQPQQEQEEEELKGKDECDKAKDEPEPMDTD